MISSVSDSIEGATKPHSPDVELPCSLLILGIALINYIREGREDDMEAIVTSASDYLYELEQQPTVSDSEALELGRVALQLCVELHSKFEETRDPQHIDLVIRCGAEAARRFPDDNSAHHGALSLLGISYHNRYERFGELKDLDRAIECKARAVSLTPESHPNRLGRLKNLGKAHQSRFDRLGKLEDIDKSIECIAHVVSLAPEGHADMPTWLNSLGNAHESRFERFRKLEDIDKSIECNAHAVSLTPEGHTDMPVWLSNLANAHLSRFERLGKMEDLGKAIECNTSAVALTPEGHEDLPGLLNNLGDVHRRRFKRLRKLEDIDKAIECNTRAVSLTPEGHVNLPGMLSNLGSAHENLFERFGKLEDIDKAIECKARAVSLTPEGHAKMPGLLSSLGSTHHDRFQRFGMLEDIDKSIECNTHAVSITPEGHEDMHSRLNNLGNAHLSQFERLGRLEDIDKSVECIARAVSLVPNGHADMPTWINNLGNAHQRRFGRLGKLEDIDKAIECNAHAVSLTPEDHAHMPGLLSNLAGAHQSRFQRLGILEDIDRAIECITCAVSLTPEGHTSLPSWLTNLGSAYLSRFEHLGTPKDIDKAIECNARAVSLTPEGRADMPSMLSNLGRAHHSRFEQFGELEDINTSIACIARAVSCTPEGHADMSTWLNNLGNVYRSRYRRLGKLEDIDKSIECHTRAVSLTPEGHVNMPSWLNNLADVYWIQYQHVPNPQTMDSALGCYRRAALSLTGSPRFRFRAACQWAQIASFHSVHDQLRAYQTAMNIVPHIVWLGATIAQRYTDVQQIGDTTLEAAAAAIAAQEYTLALEWLEQGRSIVWNQTLQLRTPLGDLLPAYPELAEELRRVSYGLHCAGTQSLHSATMSHDAGSAEHTSQQHRRLAEHYEQLVDEVRRLPGFEAFMRPKKASELKAAAQTGPLVLINVHTSRCDALILLPGRSEITHIPLPDLSPAKANQARVQLQHLLLCHNLRERGIRQTQPETNVEEEFASILVTLWKAVTKPVLDCLGYTLKPNSNAGYLPHITWCATGALSFLPLHASGDYQVPNARVFNYAVSSYTPTLSALLSTPSTSCVHSTVLAIGQEATPEQSPLPGTKEELACIKQHVQAPLSYVQLDNNCATTAATLTAMEQHDWVHLACHAHQNLEEPTDSGFFLHDGTLSLTSIMQKSFKNKGLAFLSACQTARGDENLADEAVHLASGMLMAGYPSIIGTMWSVMDTDAPLIADEVYGELLKDGKMNHKDAAKVLHVAVKELRAKVGESAFGRWVPYIHIGV